MRIKEEEVKLMATEVNIQSEQVRKKSEELKHLS